LSRASLRTKFRGKLQQRHARSHGLLSCLRLSFFLSFFPTSTCTRIHAYTCGRVYACTDHSLSLALAQEEENVKGKRESTGGGLTDSALVCLVLFFRRIQAWPFVPSLSCPPWTLPRTRARAHMRARRERELIVPVLPLIFSFFTLADLGLGLTNAVVAAAAAAATVSSRVLSPEQTDVVRHIFGRTWPRNNSVGKCK